MHNKLKHPRLAQDSPRHDVAIGALDVATTAVLTAAALATHALLLLLPAAGWAYLALRQLRLGRRAAAATASPREDR
jgi:hypothetical protein